MRICSAFDKIVRVQQFSRNGSVLWVVCRVEIARVGSTKTRDVYDHGLFGAAQKMIDATGF